MPTRPSRRERRRADRLKAKNAPSFPLNPAPSALTDPGPLPPSIFMDAAPIIRTIMRVILIQTSFAKSQVLGLAIWKEMLESANLHTASHPRLTHCDDHVACFTHMISLHGKHVRDLKALQVQYAKQVVMWGFECSKAREDWDLKFIARRQLEIAQLNRVTTRLAVAFEREVQGLLQVGCAFAVERERAAFLVMLEQFRDSFAEGVRVADQETAVALQDVACASMEEVL